MAKPGEASRDREAGKKYEVVVRRSHVPVVPADDPDRDAIGDLLGASPHPVLPRRVRPERRLLRRLLVVLPLIGVAVPVFVWLRYRSQHVTSKNAAVGAYVAEIGTRISGLVAAVAVDAGERVKAGQVMVRLDDRRLLAEVQEARGAVTGLRSAIEIERVSVRQERLQIRQQQPEAAAKVAAAQARADGARIEAEDARRNYAMMDTLHSRNGVVSTEELRNAETRRLAAEARFAEARANAAVEARSTEQAARVATDAVRIRERKIALLEADLAVAQARLTRAEADLESATIRAPDDGAIVRRIVQPGGAITAGQPVISMWLGNDLWVEAWIAEDDLGFVRQGAKATVKLHSLPGREFTGRVERIGLATDRDIPASDVPQPRFSRMNGAPVVAVRIRLDAPPPELLPGLSAVVAIAKGK
jgi:membrane fusion protein, multidrug efflux system